MKLLIANVPKLMKKICANAVSTTDRDTNADGIVDESVTVVDLREIVGIIGGICFAIVLVIKGNVTEAMAVGTTVIGYGIGRAIP